MKRPCGHLMSTVSRAAASILILCASPALAKITATDVATIESMLQSQGSSDSTFTYIGKLLQKEPRNCRLHLALARAYEKAGLTGLAEQEFEFIDQTFPDSKKQILELFKQSVSRSNWKEAFQLFSYVEKHYPNDPAVLLQGAILNYRHGKLAAASEKLKLITKLGHAQQGLETFLGFICSERKNYGEAIEHFNTELKNYPGFESALICKSSALRAMHRDIEAVKTIKPLYLRQPLRKEFAYSIATSLIEIGDYKQALEPALITLALSTTQAELDTAKKRVQTTWSFVLPEDRKKIVSTASDLLQNSPFSAHFHFALGDALQKIGYLPEAEEQFCAGLLLEPKHAKAYLHLGEIYQDLYHDNNSALNLFQESFNRDSNLLLAKQKIERLEKRQITEHHDLAQKLKVHFVAKAPTLQAARICSKLQRGNNNAM